MDLSTEIKFRNDLIENRTCTITYSGFLFKNHSDAVSIVYGFDDEWKNTTEQEMTKTENGFTTKIKLLDFTNLNFCFKNSNNEWDNNNNSNYTSPISKILEENFIINEENALNNILDDVFKCDLSEMKRENFVSNTTQENNTEIIENQENNAEIIENIVPESIPSEPVSNITNENISSDTNETSYTETVDENLTNNYNKQVIPENLFDNITDNTVDEDFSINSTQVSNFDMNSFVEDVLSPITQASVLYESTLPSEEDVNLETNEHTLEEDKKIDNLIDNLINNLYEKATNTDSEINIIDDNTSSIIDTKTETTTTNNNINENTSTITNETTEKSLFNNVTDNVTKTVQASETGLVETTDNFIVSSKSLSKFYIIRKKIKLAFYKIMSLPKIIFKNNEN